MLAPAVDAMLRAVPPQVQRALLWRERLAATSDFIACRRAFFCALASLPGVGPPPLPPPVLAPGGLMALTSPSDELHAGASSGWDSDSDRGAEDAGVRDDAASGDEDGDGGNATPPHPGAELPETAASAAVAALRLDGSAVVTSTDSPAPVPHRSGSSTCDATSPLAWRAAAAGADGDPQSDTPAGGLLGSVWHVARMEVDERGRRLGHEEPPAQTARLLETWYAAGPSTASSASIRVRP